LPSIPIRKVCISLLLIPYNIGTVCNILNSDLCGCTTAVSTNSIRSSEVTKIGLDIYKCPLLTIIFLALLELIKRLSPKSYAMVTGTTDSEHIGALFVDQLPNGDPMIEHSPAAICKAIKYVFHYPNPVLRTL